MKQGAGQQTDPDTCVKWLSRLCHGLLADASPVDQLRRYVSVFGDKPCCFADLRPYIDLMTADDQRQVRRDFHVVLIQL